jgi:hypothetical protein
MERNSSIVAAQFVSHVTLVKTANGSRLLANNGLIVAANARPVTWRLTGRWIRAKPALTAGERRE